MRGESHASASGPIETSKGRRPDEPAASELWLGNAEKIETTKSTEGEPPVTATPGLDGVKPWRGGRPQESNEPDEPVKIRTAGVGLRRGAKPWRRAPRDVAQERRCSPERALTRTARSTAVEAGAGGRRGRRQEGRGHREVLRLRSEGKSSEGDEPHERLRHETRPGGREGSKTSRGCETLKT